jgi:hypothetical protein
MNKKTNVHHEITNDIMAIGLKNYAQNLEICICWNLITNKDKQLTTKSMLQWFNAAFNCKKEY